MWVEFAPVREINAQEFRGVLGDIDSHLPADHPYKIDWKMPVGPIDNRGAILVYNGTRAINATVRGKHGGNYNAAYFLDNNTFVAEEPKVTLTQVVVAIPKELQGQQYNPYLPHQIATWDEKPLYILDELSARIVTMRFAFEFEPDMVRKQKALDLAIEWLGYGATLCNVSRQRDIVDAILEANMQIRAIIKDVPAMEEMYDQLQSYLPMAARLY